MHKSKAWEKLMNLEKESILVCDGRQKTLDISKGKKVSLTK
jgi:hypothetical protein